MSRQEQRIAWVTGRFGLVDAALLKWLGALRAAGQEVCVAPTEAAFAPAVSVADLRYMLGRMSCVDHVALAGDAAPPGAVPLEPPTEMISAALAEQRSAGPAAGRHETAPSGWTVDALCAARSVPLVMVSGCFDLIHAGHVRLIEAAARLGARPVVAALGTEAIRRQPKNRGHNRPLWSMPDRLTVLAGLRVQPRVLFFEDEDCLRLIAQLKPDVWVKSTRDRGRPVCEREARLVEALGGRVEWVAPGPFDVSTTAIEEAIKQSLGSVTK